MRELDETTAAAATAPSTLEYASAQGNESWGPVLFWPSWGAVLLLVVAGAGAVWLKLRHEPWVEVARVPSTHEVHHPFTSDGLFVTLHDQHGANVWDPATGKRVRNLLPKLDPDTQYFVVKGGEEILAIAEESPEATFYDGRTGGVLRGAHNPLVEYPGHPLVYADGSRVITNSMRRNLRTHRSGSPPSFDEAMHPQMVWDLELKDSTSSPRG